MKLLKTALIAGVLTLSVSAVALASGKPETVPPTNANANAPTNTGPEYAPAPLEPQGPKNGLPENAKAWGRKCREEGKSGTALSVCVAEKKAENHPGMSAQLACKGTSKSHVKSAKGTAFSQCLKAIHKLRRQEHHSS